MNNKPIHKVNILDVAPPKLGQSCLCQVVSHSSFPPEHLIRTTKVIKVTNEYFETENSIYQIVKD